MKVLFLGLNYAPEEIGIGLYSGDMTREWVRAGYEVEAIVGVPFYPGWSVLPGFRKRGWTRAVEHGVAITRCPLYVPAQPTGPKRILHYISFLIASLMPMLRSILSGKPDLVFTVAPSLIAAPVAWLAARLCGARCWLHVQDFETEAAFATGLLGRRGLAGRIAPWFERKVLGLFDQVSTISPQMRLRLVAKGVPDQRATELRNWADIAAVRPLGRPSRYRHEWGIGTPHVALYSGNIANKQGIDLVLDAARLLRRRQDLTFVVCGEGPNRAELERAAAGLDNIQFHDLQPRDRLSELLGLASVHLMPQIAQAADLVLPSKLTNMLASGRPIVATAQPDTGLATEIEGCGVIVSPGCATCFSGAIERVLDDEAAATMLGRFARTRAEERWARAPILDHLAVRMKEILR